MIVVGLLFVVVPVDKCMLRLRRSELRKACMHLRTSSLPNWDMCGQIGSREFQNARPNTQLMRLPPPRQWTLVVSAHSGRKPAQHFCTPLRHALNGAALILRKSFSIQLVASWRREIPVHNPVCYVCQSGYGCHCWYFVCFLS